MDVHTEKEHKEGQKEQKESKEPGSGRPRAGSESSRNPVSKVMDLIRHRSHSALSAEDKRKAVSGSFTFTTDTPVAFMLVYQSIGIGEKYLELRLMKRSGLSTWMPRDLNISHLDAYHDCRLKMPELYFY